MSFWNLFLNAITGRNETVNVVGISIIHQLFPFLSLPRWMGGFNFPASFKCELLQPMICEKWSIPCLNSKFEVLGYLFPVLSSCSSELCILDSDYCVSIRTRLRTWWHKAEPLLVWNGHEHVWKINLFKLFLIAWAFWSYLFITAG